MFAKQLLLTLHTTYYGDCQLALAYLASLWFLALVPQSYEYACILPSFTAALLLLLLLLPVGRFPAVVVVVTGGWQLLPVVRVVATTHQVTRRATQTQSTKASHRQP